MDDELTSQRKNEMESLGISSDLWKSTTKRFSFITLAVGPQSMEQTLLIMTYELGKLIEYFHKANRYGKTAYYSDANQQKEMSDLISMVRYYCEQKGWDFEALKWYGEEGYRDRMADLRAHGLSAKHGDGDK